MSLLNASEKQLVYQMLVDRGVQHWQVTPAHRLQILAPSEAQFHKLQNDISTIFPQIKGITVSYVQSCPGMDQCKYGMANSLTLGRSLEALTFHKILPHKVKISIAGCRICCTEPYLRDVGVIAERKGWKVVFGGNGGGRPRIADEIGRGLNDQQVIDLVKKSLALYIEHGAKRQRTARFIEQYGIEWLHRRIE